MDISATLRLLWGAGDVFILWEFRVLHHKHRKNQVDVLCAVGERSAKEKHFVYSKSCEFSRQAEGINPRTKKRWWLVPLLWSWSFSCSSHRLWHCPRVRTHGCSSSPPFRGESCPSELLTLPASLAQRIWIFFSTCAVFFSTCPAFFPAESRAHSPVARCSVSIWHWPGEAHRALSRHWAPSLSVASAQCSFMRKGEPNHLPDSTFLLLYSSCSPSLDAIRARFAADLLLQSSR